MALSTGIPTSFVPRQATQGPTRPQRTGLNVFLISSLGLLGISIALAAAAFGYNYYLTRTLSAKAAQLSVSENSVNESTVDNFVRLRDRLTGGKDLLDNHIMLSQLFDALEGITLQNVQYTSMNVTVAGDHTAKLQIEGTARNFNTLAAQSNAFAADKRIKRAIFSGINTTAGGLVSFSLTADLDSSLIVASTTPSAPSTDPLTLPTQPVTTGTVATTSPVVRTSSVTTSTTTSTGAPLTPPTRVATSTATTTL